MNINWQSYDGEFFQRFCNALLSLEISKSFVPYSAPGRDGGIDGIFTGAYEGRSGTWRFQDKFHKTTRKEAYKALKADVVSEIRKLAGENYFVILSNVSLLPQEKEELLSLGDEELRRLKKEGVILEIWDDAKIHTLYIRHPILRLWVEDGFTTAQVISYQNYFGARLTVGLEDPGTLANEFIARESDLKLLEDFIASDIETIAVVSGEAGIGKTRLIVEFFQNHLNKADSWQALVLNTHRINFDKISFGLSGGVNIVVLVDDAHGYAPEVIADLRNLTRISTARKLKFVLTGRRLLIDRALESVPTVEDKTIKNIPLAKLSQVETKALFERQQNIGHYRQYIPQLVTTSNGRPILIVALLRAIHLNIPIPRIKDKDVLKNYVREYFGTVIKVVSDQTQASKVRLEKLLRAICLLEPLPLSDGDFYQKLSEFAETSLTDLNYFLDKLVGEGLAFKRYEFVLSPDYYSDIVLATADEALVVAAIATFPSFISNIIVNLSSVDEAHEEGEQGGLGLDPILLLYIPQIEKAHANTVQDILSTISSIAYQKPEFGKLAIRLLVERIRKPESQGVRDLMKFDIGVRSTNRKSLYGSTSWLLHDLLYRPGNEKFVFEAVVAINECVPDMGLFRNTFGLDKRHVIQGYNFNQQNIFLAEAMLFLSKDHKQATFFIDAFSDFLKLEFTVTSLDPYKDGQINLITFYLSSDSVVVAFRKQVIDALFSIYESSSTDDIKKRVVHELMDVPRGISASKRSKNPYNGVDEILNILEFIESIAGNMPLSANREVIDRLYWIKKWGADDRIISKINDLRRVLEPKSLPEKFLFLMNNAETRIDHDYKKLIAHIEEKALVLVEEYDAQVIADSLAEVRQVQAGRLEFLWVINRVLVDGFADKAMEVYDRLWIIDRGYLHIYGSSFLTSVRFKHARANFFWNKIHELESDGSPESLNVILYVYFQLTEPIEFRDVELIERIFAAHSEEKMIAFNLLNALMTVKKYGHNVSGLITNLFDKCPQHAVDNFFTFNREMDTDFLKELALKHTLQSLLTFEVQHAISSLLEKKLISEDELFDYFVQRFEIKRAQVANEDYRSFEFVPRDNFNLFASFDEAGKSELFVRGLRWYVNSDFKGMEEYYAKDLLEFLQPSTELTQSLAVRYEYEVEHASESKQLYRIVGTLSVFESKTRTLVNLVTKILSKGNTLTEINMDELRSGAYLAITSVGVKSGAVGEPYSVDVELRKLLMDWMSDNPNDAFSLEFLSKVVQGIDREIKRSTDRNETLW